MSALDRSFVERLEVNIQELQAVREKLNQLTQRLNDAETVIRYYGDPKNYLPLRIAMGKEVFQDRLTGDHSESDNDVNTKLAGKRARDYLTRYASK